MFDQPGFVRKRPSPIPFHSSSWSAKAKAVGYRAGPLARSLGISRRTLERMIRKEAGASPRALLNRLRQERAIDLLRQGFPVKAVVLEVGYKSLSQFSREFKRFHRRTPGAVARAAKQLSHSGKTLSHFDK